MPTIRLTADEQALFTALAPALQDGWDVETEELTTYERPEELKMRLLMLDANDAGMKFVRETVGSLQAGNVDEALAALADVPRDVLMTSFFTIGATGLRGIIEGLLPSITTDEQVQGVAMLCDLRHLLLETNEEVSPVA